MRRYVIPFLLLGLAVPAIGQIGLPSLGQDVGTAVGSTLDRIGGTVDSLTGLDVRQPVRSATRLAGDRLARLTAFVRANRAHVELDEDGQPARRGVVLLLDADAASLETARQLGFGVRALHELDNLGLATGELTVPPGMALAEALRRLRGALPGKTLSADQLHFRGTSSRKPRATSPAGPAGSAAITTPVGLIDGGVSSVIPTVKARAFASGGPSPSDHGTALASLLRHAGVSRIYAADVYGRDPAGGDALAIARALDWLAAERVPVISISLVGPRNPLLEHAVGALSRKGVTVVAAVGNDGPAAPPAFPASYPVVLAVTAVDARNRALIEAGRALHLDYAAPGADIRALDARGKAKAVRGTSFATPLVAARAAAAIDRDRGGDALKPALDAEARDLGKKGPDPVFGRGLLCGDCRPR